MHWLLVHPVRRLVGCVGLSALLLYELVNCVEFLAQPVYRLVGCIGFWSTMYTGWSGVVSPPFVRAG